MKIGPNIECGQSAVKVKDNQEKSHSYNNAKTFSEEAAHGVKAIAFAGSAISTKEAFLKACGTLRVKKEEYDGLMNDLQKEYMKQTEAFAQEITELESDDELLKSTLNGEEKMRWMQYTMEVSRFKVKMRPENYALMEIVHDRHNTISQGQPVKVIVSLKPEDLSIGTSVKACRLSELYTILCHINCDFKREETKISEELLPKLKQAKASVLLTKEKLKPEELTAIFKEADPLLWKSSFADKKRELEANLPPDCEINFEECARETANDVVWAKLCGNKDFQTPNDLRTVEEWLLNQEKYGIL